MGSERRKVWRWLEGDAGSEGPQAEDPGEQETMIREEPQPESSPDDFMSAFDLQPEPEDGRQGAVSPADASDVGSAVSRVLQSAEEAAARMRGAAQADAEKIREDAKAAAEAELAEARRVRSEAEADADSMRSAATAFAQQLRSDAESEAQEMLDDARTRLERADAEVEEKLRDAERAARQRHDALEAETGRYHERLERMLGVFQAMGSQLEELLSPRGEGEAEAADEESLEDALQPAAKGPTNSSQE